MALTVRRSPTTARVVLIALFSVIVLYIVFLQRSSLPAWPVWRDGKSTIVGYTPPSNSDSAFTTTAPSTHSHVASDDDTVDWSRFAYSTYATSDSDLCNSVMLIESLHRLNVRADRQILYSQEWKIEDETSKMGKLLRKARDLYNATLKPLEIVRVDPSTVTDTTWIAGFTKLMAFDQLQYDRVLMIDSDATIFQSMDELFLLPRAPVALPRAYWLNESLSAQIVLIEPSRENVKMVREAIKNRQTDEYDMEIINKLFKDRCMILPHRPYNLLSGEFRSHNHNNYLTDYGVKWDADAILKEAKYMHFSDWPLPKPWLVHRQSTWRELQPSCVQPDGTNADDCAERRIWSEVYQDFRDRRLRVCGEEYRTWGYQEIP